jgi:hypothetical protein
MADAKYKVKVGDAEYLVTAPDANTAWQWANMTHDKETGRTAPTAPPPAQPTAAKPAPVKDGRQDEGGFFSEFGKGLRTGFNQLTNVPSAFGLQMSAAGATEWKDTLDLFNQIDAGKYKAKEFMSPAAAAAIGEGAASDPRIVGTGPERAAYAYSKASPKERQAMRERFAGFQKRDVEEVKAGVAEQAKEAAKMAPYQARVGRASDIGSLADLRDYVGGTAGTVLPQLAAIMGTAAVTKSPLATAAVSGSMTYAQGTEQRIRFIQEQVKSLPPEEQATAIGDYLKKTQDTTAMVAIATGALDLAGPAGTILRKSLVKELGSEVTSRTVKEAVKEGIRRAPREIGEEVLTGGAQEAVAIAGERNIGEQTGDILTKDNLLRVFDSAIAEGIGGVAGAGINTAAGAGATAVRNRVQKGAERELARQAKAAGIELDEESIGATYNALVAKYVAEGMREDQALIQASRALPSTIGVSGDELGVITPSGGAPAAAPTVSVANVNAPGTNVTSATTAPASLQAVTPEKVAEVLPVIDAEFAEYADDIETEYGVTELTPDVRNAVAELIVSSPGIAPIDAIGSVIESTQRAAAAPTAAPVAPAADMSAPIEPTANPIEITPAPALDMSAPLKQRTVVAQQLVADTITNDPTLAGLGITDRQQAMAKNQLANGRQPDAAAAINAVLNKTQLAAIAPQPAVEALAPAVVPGPPSVDQVAVAPIKAAIEQAAAPTGGVIPSLAETAARAIGIAPEVTAAPVAEEVAPKAVFEPQPSPQQGAANQTADPAMFNEGVRDIQRGVEPLTDQQILDAQGQEALDAYKAGMEYETQRTAEPVTEETAPEVVAEEVAPEVVAEEVAPEVVTEEVASEVAPEIDPYDAMLDEIETALIDEEIDQKAYKLLKVAASTRRVPVEKIAQTLQQNKDRYGEEQMSDAEDRFNQRYRPGTENVGIPLADAQTAVGAAAKGIGATPNVVQTFADLPLEAQEQAFADGATDAAGITTLDGQVHLVADQFADAADAVATLYHEVLGHLGLARLFRSRLDSRLKEMYRGNKKLRDDTDAFIAENPDAYPNDPDPLARAVEEILAQRSEAGKIEASLLAKITGVIKDVGRRVGIKLNFSDAEVEAILSRAHDMAINGTQEGETGQRYARKKKTGPSKELQRAEEMLARSRNPGNMNQATSAIMKLQRSGRRLRHLMNIIPGVITTKRGRFMLQFLTPADVGRLAKRQSKALGMRLDKVALAMSQMNNTNAAMRAKVSEQAYRWNKFNGRFKEGSQLLSDVMNLGTLYDIDPRRAANVRDFIAQDEKIKAIIADPKLGQRAKDNRIKARTELVEAVYKRWDGLARKENGNGEGRKIFDMAANAYRETFDRKLNAIVNRINNSALSPTRKAAAVKQIKAQFAEAEKIGLYFPLGRDEGDYWMRVGAGKNREYQQFASQVERDLAMRERYDEMVENGEARSYDDIIYSGELSFGDNANELQNDVVENDPTNMLQGILNELDAGNIGDLKAVKEQLTQMYLQTMPKPAQAAAMQRRGGVSGFTSNTLRTFVTTQNAAASNLARLEHGDAIRNNLAMAYALIQNDPEQDKLKPYVDQFAEFAGRQLAPTPENPVLEFTANFLNRATFLYMMTSLKTAIIQPLQLSTVGMSALIRDYGWRAPALAFRNMTRFYKLLGTSKLDEDGNVITKWGQPSMNDGGYINDNPDPEMQRVLKSLWNGGNDRGLFSNNFTGDVTGDRQLDVGVFDNVVLEKTRQTLNFVHNFMTGAGFHTERISREVMFMSAAELEYKKLRKEGVSEADALKRAEQKAADLTIESLFDYNMDAKPMVARGPIGRIVFQFATFVMNMSSLLIRNFYNAVSLKSSLQERRDASIMFFGTLASTFMWAGVTGMPLYTMFMGLADVARELFRPLLEDEDEDPRMYNAESGNPLAYASMDLWFRQWFLPKMMGGGMAQRAVEMGPISAATDLNFSASLSLNDMFFRDEQPADNVADAVQNLLLSTGMGASGSMIKQVSQGIDFMLKGEGDRAAEKLMPYSFLRQPLIARRLQEEGYVTPKGVELKPAEFYTAGKLAGQWAGFGSTEVAEAQKRNILFSRATDKVEDVRSKVQRGYGDAYLKYLSKPTAENLAAYKKANEQWEEYNMDYGLISPITQDQMQQSVVSRAEDREIAKQLGGIQTDKQYRTLAQDMLAQDQ